MQQMYKYILRSILALFLIINISPLLQASEAAQDTAALKAEIDSDIKKGGGVIPFDKLTAIWNKVSKTASEKTDQGQKLLDLLVKKLPTVNSLIQSKAGIKNVAIEAGPSAFQNSFVFKGTVEVPGSMPLSIVLLHVPASRDGSQASGNSLTFSFPPGMPLDKVVPGMNVKALGGVTISQCTSTISDFEYTDPITSYPIAKGLNILVGIDPSAMKIFNADKLKDIIDFQGGNILGVSTITKTPEEEAAAGKAPVAASFKVILPPNMIKLKKFKLSTLVDLFSIPIPDKIKSDLSKVEVDQLDVGMDFTPNYQSFALSGVVDLFGVKNVRTRYKIYKADKSSTDKSNEKNVLVNELLIEMPDSWSIAQQVPELKMLDSIMARDQRFLLVSRAHRDMMTGEDVLAGVSYVGTIELNKLASIPVLQGLGKAFGNEVKLRGRLASKLADSEFEMMLALIDPSVPVTLADLVPPSFDAGKQYLAKVQLPIKDLQIKFGGPKAVQVSTGPATNIEIDGLIIDEHSNCELATSLDAANQLPQKTSKVTAVTNTVKTKLSDAMTNLKMTAKSNFKLDTLAKLTNLNIPEKIKAELARAGVESINMIPGEQSFGIESTVSMFGINNVKFRYEIYKADRSSSETTGEPVVLVNKLSIDMPNSWSIGKQIPELKVLAPITALNQSFTFVSNAHRDLMTGLNVPAGVSYSGMIRLDQLGDDPFLKSLGKVLGDNVMIQGTLATKLSDSKFEVSIGQNRLKEAKLSLGDLIPSKFGRAKKDLSKVTVSLGQFGMKINNADDTKSVLVTGTASAGGVQMPTKIRAEYRAGEWKTDIILTMQQKAPGIEALNVLNSIPLTSITMALIQAPFVDPVTGVAYEEGLNIGGYLGFTGKMSFVDKIFRIKGLNVNGVIKDFKTTAPTMRFSAALPGDQTMDFGKGVKMTRLSIFVDVGVAPATGIQGSIFIPVPKEFRPKKGTPSKPIAQAFINVPIDSIASSLATSMDSEAIVVSESEDSETSANDQGMQMDDDESDVGDVVIEDESVVEEAPDLTPFEGEIPSPMAGQPEPQFIDEDIDMSGYAEPVGDNNALTLDASLAVSGESGILTCAMDGAIDIKGLVLENVAFEGQMAMSVPPVPTGLGFRADFQISGGSKPKIINFAAKMAAGTTTTSLAWIGSYKGGLYLSDLVNIAFTVTKRAPGATQEFRKEFFNAMKKVPKIGIDELSMAIVPVPTTIAGKMYEEGTSVDMKLVLLGVRGQANAQIGYTGISGKGSLNKVAYPKNKPQFIISSFDGATGPSISFNVGKGSKMAALGNEFTVDGNMEIKPLAFKNAVKMNLAASGLTFNSVGKMFGLYESDISGSMVPDQIKSTQLKAVFKQDSLEKIANLFKEASKKVLEEGVDTLNKAKEDINNEFNAKIEKQRAIVRAEREKATKKISGADQAAKNAINKEIDEAKKKLDRLKGDLNNHKKKCKKNPLFNADDCGKVVGDGAAIAAQEVYIKGLLKPAKTVTSGTLDVAKGAVNLTPIDSDPRVAALITAKETALAGIKAGKWGSRATSDAMKELASATKKGFNITYFEIDVHLGELMKGKLPKVSFEGIVLGKKVKVKQVALDLKNPGDIKKVAKSIINNVM